MRTILMTTAALLMAACADETETAEVEIVKLDDFSYRLNFIGTATETGRFVRGKIKLKTNIDGESEIEVPYFGTLLGQRSVR